MSDPENHGDPVVHEVLVTRTQTQNLFIMARSPEEALRDAEELWDPYDNSTDDIEAEVIAVHDGPSRNDAPVWTGGENGEWAPWSEVRGRVMQ